MSLFSLKLTTRTSTECEERTSGSTHEQLVSFKLEQTDVELKVLRSGLRNHEDGEEMQRSNKNRPQIVWIFMDI